MYGSIICPIFYPSFTFIVRKAFLQANNKLFEVSKFVISIGEKKNLAGYHSTI
jgi:hypothetical protein